MTVTVLEVIQEGSGPSPKCGDKCVVHYTGHLAAQGSSSTSGAPFDCSWTRGHAFTFTVGVGKVIQGWDDAVQTMAKGARRRILISSDDAYGPAGRRPAIPPNADLIFDLHLLNINETLVEEGMRIRREESERADRFLKIQDQERAAEAALQQSTDGPKRKRDDSDDGSSTSSSSDDDDERRRRKREKKERRKERKKRHKDHKKKKDKGKHEKRKHAKDGDKDERKRSKKKRRSSSSS